MRAGAVMAAILLALVLLGSCGKKGPLEVPPGATNTFPRTYPSE
jgi:predicted small lipoprotein YifL